MDLALLVRSMEKKLHIIAASVTRGLSFMIGTCFCQLNPFCLQASVSNCMGKMHLFALYSVSLSLGLWGLLV